MKRRHLNVDDTESSHCMQNIKWMRINAERERVLRFKNVSIETAASYYKILDRFSSLIIKKKNLCKQINRDDWFVPEHSSAARDLQIIMKHTFAETQLHNTLKFICEYIKRVNENGYVFTAGHFFILLLELTVDDLRRIGSYLFRSLFPPKFKPFHLKCVP